jgi:trimeric autotransporter adhesin
VNRTKVITVVPPARPSTFDIAPAGVTGGSNATGTVTLDRAAPAGGAVVTITESATELSAPATVTVNAAATTGTFTITTIAVTASVTRTVEVSRLGQSRSDTLIINPSGPITITSFTIDRGQITARTPVLGTVTFSTGAPAGYSISGFDNSAFTSIPAVINVTEGQNKVSFTIATSPVSVNTQSTASVRKGAQTFNRIITIVPPRLATFQISPTVVKGGSFALGSIQLTGPAPAAGIVVNMSSNGPQAIVPATVNFPVNVGLIRQRIDTTPVTVQVIRTITVTQGATTRTGNLTIRP